MFSALGWQLQNSAEAVHLRGMSTGLCVVDRSRADSYRCGSVCERFTVPFEGRPAQPEDQFDWLRLFCTVFGACSDRSSAELADEGPSMTVQGLVAPPGAGHWAYCGPFTRFPMFCWPAAGHPAGRYSSGLVPFAGRNLTGAQRLWAPDPQSV